MTILISHQQIPEAWYKCLQNPRSQYRSDRHLQSSGDLELVSQGLAFGKPCSISWALGLDNTPSPSPLEDILLLIIGRVLLGRSSRRWKLFDAGFFGLILAQVHLLESTVGCLLMLGRVITTTSAAMEIVFFWETSAEIKWSQAGIFLDEPEGMKLLFSGANKVLMVLLILLVVAKASDHFCTTVSGSV
jgi:hypothetical protein